MRWQWRAASLLLVLVLAGCMPDAEYQPTPTKTPDPIYEQGGGGVMAANTGQAAQASVPAATSAPAASPTATTSEQAETTSLPPVSPAPTTAAGATPAAGQSTETTAATSPATAGPVEPTTTQAAPTEPAAGEPAGTTAPRTPAAPSQLSAEHYWLQRPIPSGYTMVIDRTYPYGSTAGGRLRPHTGVEFFNQQGTPALAAANAVVAYAGTDAEALYGPQNNFYGNLIILQLTDVTYLGQPIYTLYGHLSSIGVENGETVTAGQEIGKVGGTGIANGGAHLHFEVRIGDPAGYYSSTRNPELWLAPFGGRGTIAGRIIQPDGPHIRGISVVLQHDDGSRFYTFTYAGAENIPDNEAVENFTYGDLREGWYTVSANSGRKIYTQRVFVEAGRTSVLEIIFDK